jgi:translation initiation factor IF-3
VVGPNGEQLGIVDSAKGLELANQYELDLVEVAPNVNPPVCRIMDFSKFKYDQEKKEREANKHHHAQIKEIRVRPNIEKHDYEVKLRQAKNFLKKGNKVKINLMFRGREMTHQELGRKIIDNFIADTTQEGQVEKNPILEGRILTMLVSPK